MKYKIYYYFRTLDNTRGAKEFVLSDSEMLTSSQFKEVEKNARRSLYGDDADDSLTPMFAGKEVTLNDNA